MPYTKDFEERVLKFIDKTENDLINIKDDINELKKDVKNIKSCPTIKNELSNLQKNKK